LPLNNCGLHFALRPWLVCRCGGSQRRGHFADRAEMVRV